MRRRKAAEGVAVTFACVLALGAAGCGSGSDDTGSSPGGEAGDAMVAQLLDRVPSQAYLVKAMDLAGAKRELAVAADLDPKRYREPATGPPEKRFDDAAIQVLDYLVVKSRFAAALDHGMVQAAVRATMIPGGDLTIIRTAQPRGEIERGLEHAGLRRSGADGYVLSKRDAGYGLAAAVLGDDGLVALAETLDVASAPCDAPTPIRASRRRGSCSTRPTGHCARSTPMPRTRRPRSRPACSASRAASGLRPATRTRTSCFASRASRVRQRSRSARDRSARTSSPGAIA